MTNPDPVFGALGAALSAYATAQETMVAAAQDIKADGGEDGQATDGNDKKE